MSGKQILGDNPFANGVKNGEAKRAEADPTAAEPAPEAEPELP